jgi:glycosyltransferase involved in cell wall biosynthesis
VKFSIVIASYLGNYPSASHGREQKIVRAINSVLGQTFTDFEIIVVADGCQKTIDIVKDLPVRSFLIPRGSLFGGAPRNKGIDEAEGDYIVYLDIDDIYGRNHLQIIADNLESYDWVWYNDIRYSPRLKIWHENECDIVQVGRHGTSNVCHKASLSTRWEFKGYAHDHYFVQKLRENTNFKKIATPEYYVCHIPGTQSSGGYDL